MKYCQRPLFAICALALSVFWPAMAVAQDEENTAANTEAGADNENAQPNAPDDNASKSNDSAADATDSTEVDTDDEGGESAESEKGQGESLGFQRSGRMEFDERLVKGQAAKSGAVYLFERTPRRLPGLVPFRRSYRTRIVEPVLGKRELKPPVYTTEVEEKQAVADAEEKMTDEPEATEDAATVVEESKKPDAVQNADDNADKDNGKKKKKKARHKKNGQNRKKNGGKR